MSARRGPRPWSLVLALALACTRAPEPAGARSPPSAAPGEAAKAAAPANEVAGAATAAAASERAAGRACAPGERLDSGCVCREGGACSDICCGEGSGCAHAGQPGGPPACVLSSLVPAAPAPARACEDGEALASGCRCDATTCMDICCVGSACSHHASPDGGWAKCVSLPRRRP